MIQTGDWIKIHYTGRLQENNKVFDTTDKHIAEEAKLDTNVKYGLFTMCVGEGHIIKGIDKSLIGKNVGDSYKIKLPAEEAFGKKNPKLLQLISKAKFTKNKINPQPGLRVNIDGQEGLIKSISGGRVIVDFNHPLAGKDVEYEIKIDSIIDNDEEKIKGYLSLLFQKEIPFEFENDNKNNIILKYPLPPEMISIIEKELSRLLSKDIKIKNPNNYNNKGENSHKTEKNLNNEQTGENK